MCECKRKEKERETDRDREGGGVEKALKNRYLKGRKLIVSMIGVGKKNVFHSERKSFLYMFNM